MPSKGRIGRLSNLIKMHPVAAMDHRFFLDESGKHTLIEALPRKKRRELAAASKKIGEEYGKILKSISSSGAGYLTDMFVRQLAVEYTHRYASSGACTQPISFNYFEPFCKIDLITNSIAPYAFPVTEVDHLFGIADFFDFATSNYMSDFQLTDLSKMPEGVAFHFNTAGSVFDFTFLNADGREFVIGGFSIVRHGNSVHWFLVGGEVFTGAEWVALSADQYELGDRIPPNKRLFLEAVIKEKGKMSGPPVALEGTNTVLKTIVCGEIDILTSKHISRCIMKENGNSFSITCDDPEIFMTGGSRREETLAHMQDEIRAASPMWGLAEALFQLPAYFAFKISITQTVQVSKGKKIALKVAKGGRGVGAKFKTVSSIEVTNSGTQVLWPVSPPHYDVEIEGHWRRLDKDSFGVDREGNPIQGKTWIKADNSWRAREGEKKTIYVKSSIAAARLKKDTYMQAASCVNALSGSSGDKGVLYVLRCVAMRDEIYKVGWTSGTAEERAKELSSATGVPSGFSVVTYWTHPDPEGLEKGVHAILSPYRVDDRREFFEAPFSTIKSLIEAEIKRSQNHL